MKDLSNILKDEFYSPYRIAKIESQLRSKNIPPQKLYGYCRQGYIKFSKNSTGKIQISKSEATKYLTKFVK